MFDQIYTKEKKLVKKAVLKHFWTRERQKRLLQMSEISLWLDTYDDIFSDFDPRPYSQRRLSDDFLWEARKASRDKASGQVELKFLIPKHKKKVRQEKLIKQRLREHFKKHFGIIKKEVRHTIKMGILFILAGIILMLGASLILSQSKDGNFLINFFIVFLEPGGWFLFWEGLGLVIFEAKKKRPQLKFYEKMAKCEISFLPY